MNIVRPGGVVTAPPAVPAPLPEGHELAGKSVEELQQALAAAEQALYHQREAERLAQVEEQRRRFLAEIDAAEAVRVAAEQEEAERVAEVWPLVAALQKVLTEGQAARMRARAAEGQVANCRNGVHRLDNPDDNNLPFGAPSPFSGLVTDLLLRYPLIKSIAEAQIPGGVG